MRRSIVFVVTAVLILSEISSAYINIHPYRIYLDTQRGKKEEEIVLYNRTDRTLRYKISVDDIRLKDRISYYPQVITLKPGEERGVRFRLEKTLEELERREYYSEILIEQLRMPVKDHKGEFVQSYGVEVYPKVKIPLKIYSGSEKIALRERDDTGLENISGREINLELFHREGRGSKEQLGFIKNLRLSKGEMVNLESFLKEYQKKKGIRGEIILRDIVILEKISGEKIERVRDKI